MSILVYKDLIEILNRDRSKWIEQIQPHIVNTNQKERISILDTNFPTEEYSFLPEELDPSYQWKFNIGDKVTNGTGIMKVIGLPVLDPRNEENFQAEAVWEFGNKYITTFIDNEGNELEDKDSDLYLHYFNENEIQCVK